MSIAEPSSASTDDQKFPTPSILVVMGVAGSGKSTIGTQLAIQLHWEFEDGDWFHPARNIDKMHNGIPLTDEDRAPWLIAIADFIDTTRSAGGHAVIACSALKRRYRTVIIGNRPDVRLIYLKGNMPLIARRIAARHEHFMPASLLQSQFDALEEPGPEERPIIASIEPHPREIVLQILAALNLQMPQAQPRVASSG
ncbi:MAG TPA: gluconokinase [Xanthobacteraceae bacterium]|jgi:carbohydrate kinase (thermoresistant glucokinase family)